MILELKLYHSALMSSIGLKSSYSLPVALFLIFGYLTQSSVLLLWLRHAKGVKIQPNAKIDTIMGGERSDNASVAVTPLGWAHYPFVALNLTVAAIFAGATCELSSRGWGSRMDFAPSPGSWRVGADFVVAFAWQTVLEYGWHRLMHTRLCYRTMHKFHHYYKSPEPFCDMYIHPLESFGYQLILWSPPFIFSCHVYAFVLYMAVMGLCGVLDHSGVRCAVGGDWGYSTLDHDLHHELYNWNYGFPLPLLDKLFGTYRDPLSTRGAASSDKSKVL